MSSVSLQSRPKRSPNVVHEFAPPEYILFLADKGYYYSTNKIGAAVWERCDGQTTVDDMMREISKESGIPLGDLHKEVVLFLNAMRNEGLIL